jgi:hypothetical protein
MPPAQPTVTPPSTGLIAMRIATEFGSPDEFSSALDRALARGGERGASIVAELDGGNLAIHLPREDGPAWNSVPLLHLRRGDQPTADQWRAANAVLEKLERFR